MYFSAFYLLSPSPRLRGDYFPDPLSFPPAPACILPPIVRSSSEYCWGEEKILQGFFVIFTCISCWRDPASPIFRLGYRVRYISRSTQYSPAYYGDRFATRTFQRDAPLTHLQSSLLHRYLLINNVHPRPHHGISRPHHLCE